MLGGSFDVYLVTSPRGKHYVGLTGLGVDNRWAAH